jgi:heavy metal sensor kinase
VSRLPIRVRLTAATAIVMSVVLAAIGLVLYARVASDLSASVDRDLRVRSQDLAALVRRSPSQLPETGAGTIVEQGESYAQVLARDGRPVAGTPSLGDDPLLSSAQVAKALSEPVQLDKATVPGLDEPSRLLATGVPYGRSRAVLVVGQTLQDRAETLARLREELLIAGPFALILACGLGWVLAGVSLRQVESMRRQAAEISDLTAEERLPVPPTGDELERLATTLNSMLDRLQGALERERAFVADAGHELRTPLTVLRTELDLALRQAGSVEELRAAVLRSSREAARLSQLAEDLLLIARSKDRQLPLRTELLHVDDVFAAVLARFEWRAADEGKRLYATSDTARADADRLRLEQALSNLVDNALRYGGDEVHLEARAADGAIQLHVRDSGGGLPDGFEHWAFERFTRADPSRSGGGAGLGLAIVRTIAEAHGGSVGAENAADGGADVWLSLPCNPAGGSDHSTIG